MTTQRRFLCNFFRNPQPGEIGPVPVQEMIESKSKKRATEWAKSIAKERGWRLLELQEIKQ